MTIGREQDTGTTNTPELTVNATESKTEHEINNNGGTEQSDNVTHTQLSNNSNPTRQTETDREAGAVDPTSLNHADSPSLSLVSSVATSEDDVSSREDSARPGGRKKKHRVRFADTSVSSWTSTVQDGFLYNMDPFSTARKQCPRHILSSIDRLCKVPETDLDEFGQVSKRALPEHYYANTGAIGSNSRRKQTIDRSRSPGRSGAAWRDRHTVDDFSHPRCFANPKNNVKLITMYDQQTAGYLDTSLTSPRTTLQSSTSKIIRFMDPAESDGAQRPYTDSPANSSQRTAKSPSDSDGFFYGQRRPGVKIHSCINDG